ncbi:hypothetical protein TNCV_4287841 [Trichonephila clavipes]|uniref:Uncharacterized protein n=1 Tax=Trichonephila clavipes TaxID=2585209 RepID=A0A8X6SIZ8_TRICX|nr:hypothetical protein TNCV_4287841 [Trichonephila clavipes]
MMPSYATTSRTFCHTFCRKCNIRSADLEVSRNGAAGRKFDTVESNMHRWRKQRDTNFPHKSPTKLFTIPEKGLDTTEDNIVRKSGDSGKSSEVRCDSGSDDSFLEQEIVG